MDWLEKSCPSNLAVSLQLTMGVQIVSIFVGLEYFGLLCAGDVDYLKSLQNRIIWVSSVVMSTLRCNGSLAK